MTNWDDFRNQELPDFLFTGREKTDIACPRCGEPIYRRTDIVLTSYPPQYQYECDNCNWVGYAYR